MPEGVSEEGRAALPYVWRLWLAENRLLGVQEQALVRIMLERGFQEAAVQAEMCALDADPYFQAGARVAQRLHKLESLADTRHSLSALDDAARDVERVVNPSRQEFLDSYYSRNRPAVLIEAMNSWAALSRWSPQYLSELCGDEVVEVMLRRNSDPRYEINCRAHKEQMLFSDYVNLVASGEETNDYYLVANNFFLRRPAAAPLFDDMGIFPQYLDQTRPCGSLWFGPPGTITPLHHDMMNIILAQVVGRKLVVLISPDQTHLLYNSVGVFSEVDWEKPDTDRFPRFCRVVAKTFVLKPGEVLFIPVGWWHYVRSLDISISVSFTNFIWSNHFAIRNPALST